MVRDGVNLPTAADSADYLGAITAHAVFLLASLVFVFRLAEWPRAETWAGWAFVSTGMPLIVLLALGVARSRPPLYLVQVGVMLLFVVVLLLLEHVLHVDFRRSRWAVIGFVMLFFAGLGGMLGVAARAGHGWLISSVTLFFATGTLAFVQRAITGR